MQAEVLEIIEELKIQRRLTEVSRMDSGASSSRRHGGGTSSSLSRNRGGASRASGTFSHTIKASANSKQDSSIISDENNRSHT